jgi:HlyD family secretion protein
MRRFFTKKRIIWGIIILLVVGGFAYRSYKSGNDTSNIITELAKVRDLKQTVLATGQVVSNTDLNLSFKVSGIVRKVNVTVGQKVKEGEVLAYLEQKDQQAALTSARGSLAQAQANYQRVLEGATSEEVLVAQRAVDAAQVTLDNTKTSLENTKNQQDVLVANAYSAYLNSGLEAIAATGNLNTSNPTVSGTYTGSAEGQYVIRQAGKYFFTQGLETTGDVAISTNSPVTLGTKGLYIQFPITYISSNSDYWLVNIPNTKAATYLANYNAYNSALQTKNSAISTAQSAVNSAQAAYEQALASLNLKKAEARPADVKASQAQVLSAQGQVEAAQSALENTLIRAPSNGTITSIDFKPGELASALKEVIVLQDVENLYLEANISEANISGIKIGQVVDVTFDALGPDEKHTAQVSSVDPASTVVQGVVNYKVKAEIERVDEVKPGMTANMTILTIEKPQALSIPERAIINSEGKKFVRVVSDNKSKKYSEVEVMVGISADGGFAEVLSGIKENDEVVTFIEQK